MQPNKPTSAIETRISPLESQYHDFIRAESRLGSIFSSAMHPNKPTSVTENHISPLESQYHDFIRAESILWRRPLWGISGGLRCWFSLGSLIREDFSDQIWLLGDGTGAYFTQIGFFRTRQPESTYHSESTKSFWSIYAGFRGWIHPIPTIGADFSIKFGSSDTDLVPVRV